MQSNASLATHASVILCQMTSAQKTLELTGASDFCVTVAPDATNGLREHSQIMADTPLTVRRARIGATVGRLAATDLRRLDVALAFAMGLEIEGGFSWHHASFQTQRSNPEPPPDPWLASPPARNDDVVT